MNVISLTSVKGLQHVEGKLSLVSLIMWAVHAN